MIRPSPPDRTQPAWLGQDVSRALAHHDDGAYLHDLAEAESQSGD